MCHELTCLGRKASQRSRGSLFLPKWSPLKSNDYAPCFFLLGNSLPQGDCSSPRAWPQCQTRWLDLDARTIKFNGSVAAHSSSLLEARLVHFYYNACVIYILIWKPCSNNTLWRLWVENKVQSSRVWPSKQRKSHILSHCHKKHVYQVHCVKEVGQVHPSGRSGV
jgi:hypothetical protein